VTAVTPKTDADKGLAPRVAAGSAVAAGATAGAVAIAGLGAAPIAIGVCIAAPIYAGCHLAVHAIRKRRHQPETPVALRAAPALDTDAQTLATLDAFLGDTRGKVPATVQSRIDRIAKTVRDTIPRLDQLPPGSEQAHAVVRTATNYMPEAVAAYLRLPRDFADRRAVSGSKTSLSVLCDQLDLLASKMDEVFDAACRADADALIAHGRFLAEKFGSGALALDPEKR
jgi:hypothetical protein